MRHSGHRFLILWAQETWRRWSRRARLFVFRVSKTFIKVPERLIVAPVDLRGSDPHIAHEIVSGRFPFAGDNLETNGRSPFLFPFPSDSFATRLHSFRWLRHMRSYKSTHSFAVARMMVDSWISIHGHHVTGMAWEIDTTAQRIIAWLSHSPILLQDAERSFYRRFMKSLALQIRYLRFMASCSPSPEVLFRVRIALSMAAIALPDQKRRLRTSSQALDHEIDRQIFADGSHISRNPRAPLELLLDLLPLRQAYVNLGHDQPAKLIAGIDRMYPALRFFRHQDGDLALFNGATATSSSKLMSVLRYDETTGEPFKALPHSQYHRLAANNSVVIVDAGLPSKQDRFSTTAHAGCLSFEFSSGRHRFIVNAGSPTFAGARTTQLARTTAAHSTVTVNDKSSSRISSSAFLRFPLTGGIKTLTQERFETEDGRDCLKACHDGYLKPFGILHEREVSLNRAGSIVTGCDRMIVDQKRRLKTALEAVARFHVHPAIELRQDTPETIQLRSPDGETWLFCAPGIELQIIEDLFFADAAGLHASELIEITFNPWEKPEIRWFLSRKSERR